MDAAALGKRLGRNGFGVPLPVLRSQAELQLLSQYKGSSTCWSPEVVRGADLALQRGPAVPEQPPWGTSEVRGPPSLQAVVLSTTVGRLLPCGHSRSGRGAGEYPRVHSKAQCGLGTMLGWCSLTCLAWLHDTWSLIQVVQIVPCL